MATVDQSKGISRMVNDFGKRFANRSTPAELVQKNILKEDEIQSNISNSIIAQKMALEEEKRKDQLNRRLSNRPSKVDLKLRNILKPGESADFIEEDDAEEEPGVPPPRRLTINQRSEQLKSILKKRPEKQQLEGMNILKATGTDASLAAVQEKLKRAQLENTLENRLRDRPPVEELQNAKILVFAETVEVLPTFRKSEYNRKPDASATFKNLTPQMKVQIREELNSFKKNEMPVHEDSMRNTCFH